MGRRGRGRRVRLRTRIRRKEHRRDVLADPSVRYAPGVRRGVDMDCHCGGAGAGVGSGAESGG